MAGLAHGGGKSVIIGDPRAPAEDKARLVRSFARAIAQIEDYIPGPDMGTNETSMAQVKDLIGRAVGLPREVGGIPLDEIGATGFGISVALEAAEHYGHYQLSGARVVVEGFGSVGMHAARFLAGKGAALVGVSDSRGARVCAGGFNLDRLIEFKNAGHSVSEFDEGDAIDGTDLVAVDCEIWIPAARPDVLRADNVEKMRAKVIAQGANIPATPEAELMLAESGVLVLPDFVVNAGGVICGAVEYHHGSEAQALATIENKIRTNILAVLERAAVDRVLPRAAALTIARERVATAMTFRGTF
jgi:glutamate dehydrogenase/leucine dehydrogenase